jgi:hypothetical protein
MLDRARLVKLLQMTASPVEAEALAAIRAANKMLAEAGVGWTGLISGSRARLKTGEAPPWMRPAPTMTIPEALDFLEGEGEMIDDLLAMRTQWQRRKYLSPSDQRRLFDRVYDLKKSAKAGWEPE